MRAADEPVLVVRDLAVEFDTPAGRQRAVDGVSFEVMPDEVFCVVGESGSGKSVTSLAVMGLLPQTAHVASGLITFKGRDLMAATPAEMRGIRGKELAMIFQDPMTSLNPVITVGRQIGEMVRLHDQGKSREQVRSRVVDLLRAVKVPNAEVRYSSYPHEFSGGMRQRAMIAMATAHNPDLLIADEPTTALDVTIQAQVLELLAEMRASSGAALMLITHDLGVVAEVADRVMVMYAGRVAEQGTVEDVFYRPRHPYTVGLLASVMGVDDESEVAYAIPGQPPVASRRPSGCPFHPRCSLSRGRQRCATEVPEVLPVDVAGHLAACHFAEEVSEWVQIEFPAVSSLAGEPDDVAFAAVPDRTRSPREASNEL